MPLSNPNDLLPANKEAALFKEIIHLSKLAAIGDLASEVSHEINNPLAIIIGNIEDIRDEAKEKELEDEELMRHLAIIEKSIMRIASIVGALNILSRGRTVDSGEFNVNSGIKQAVGLLEPIYKKKKININLELNCPNPIVEGDLGSFHQIILNLMSNAKEALFGNRGDTIVIRTESSGQFVTLTISDNGGGIKSDIKDKIFDMFFTTKQQERGAGLGLSIVNSIVKKMGGVIGVESEPGKGTIFTLSIPTMEKK